ncbi:flagellar filament capping protein FliD [Pectobacterium brasiliense]|uniref:flagellar filament capping protein FliD n=1 Tax=Pectobacterium brasiliense TaxID=180957 RepID=UPI00201C2D51|nr:flagellar filament capping protein FliD [Pectobacterium brasiliense]MCL6377679.1 flagellar filament capping protein FliD [Pectobacterium brasiliense]
MASISFTGSTSGFTDILNQLTSFEQTRITPVNNQQKVYKNRDTAFDTLKTALTKLESANAALAKANEINKTAVSGENKAFSATSTGKAVSGTYNVEVQNLAAAHSVISAKETSNKTVLGDGSSTRTLTIKQDGQDKPLEIKLTQEQTSLEGIRDAVNKANGDVSASIIKADDSSYYLSITSKSTGTDSQMTISVSGDDQLNQKLSYTAGGSNNGMKQQTAAENAILQLNGIQVVRQSNTIDDAIEGVTLNLKSKTAIDTPETLTLTGDNAPMQKAIQEWVDAYNALQTTIGNLTKFTPTDPNSDAPDASNGVLLGNGTVRSIQTKLKMQISSAQNGMDISTLNEMGIKQNPTDGKLEIDSSKLQKSLQEKNGSVTEFFVGDGKNTGFATQVNTYLDSVLKVTSGNDKGSIQIAKESIAATQKTLTKTEEQTKRSIEDNIARYKAQFTQLDKLVSQMNGTSDYLTSQLAALNK